MAGSFVVPQFSSKVRVSFDSPFEATPSVSLTPVIRSASESAFMADATHFAVMDITTDGFTLAMDLPTIRDMEYSYTAIIVKDKRPSTVVVLEEGNLLGAMSTGSGELVATPSGTPAPVELTPTPTPQPVETVTPTPTPVPQTGGFGDIISPI